MEPALRQTFAAPLVRRNLVVAAVIGTVLNLINQGDALVAGAALDWFKICLTYCVPFLVASYGTYGALRAVAARREDGPPSF
jgi:methyl-accepting chemotaxis protein